MAKNKDVSETEILINNKEALGSMKEVAAQLRELRALANSTHDPKIREQAIAQTQKLGKLQRDFNQELKITKTGWDKFNDGWKSFGVAAGLTIGIDQLISFGKASYHAFAEAELNAKRLESAVGINGGLSKAYEDLIEQSEQLQRSTIFSDDEIQIVETMGVQFGFTADQLKKIIPLVTDFASDTRQSLESAFQKLIMGVQGSGKGIKQFGIVLDETNSKSQNLTSILEQLNKKYKGHAEVVAQTESGAMARFNNRMGDMQEQIGEFVSGIANAGVTLFEFVMNGFKPLNDEIDKTNEKLFKTTQELIKFQTVVIDVKIGMLSEALASGAGNALKIKEQLEALNNQKISIQIAGMSDQDLEKRVDFLNKFKFQTKEQASESKILVQELLKRNINAIAAETDLTKLTLIELKYRQKQLIQANKETNDFTLSEALNNINAEIKAREAGLKKVKALKKQHALEVGLDVLEQDIANLDHLEAVEKLHLTQQHADGLISEKEYQNKLLEEHKKYLVVKLFLLKSFGKDTTGVEQEIAETTIKLNTILLDSIKEQNVILPTTIKKTWKDGLKDILGYVQQYASQLSSIWTNLNKISDNKSRARLEEQTKYFDKEKERYQALLDRKIISQGQYNIKVSKLQQDQEKLQRKEQHDTAVRNRSFAYFNAAISTSQGVAQALTVMPPWLGISMAAIVGSMGLLEMGLIASEKIPELGRGKKFTGIGKHPFSRKKVQDSNGEISHVEDGEVLLSAATADNNPIVDDLLNASLNNNGRLPFVEDVAPEVDVERIADTIRTNRASFGSSTVFDPSGGDQEGRAIVNHQIAMLLAMIDKQNTVIDNLRVTLENGITAKLGYHELNRDKKRLDTITGKST